MRPADLSRRSGEGAKAEDHSEVSRQLVHLSMGGFALLLRWLSWGQALALAAAALVFNLFILPRFAHALYRPGDRERAIHGIVLYPLAVLVLIATCPSRPDIAAAAWGILAAGDGVATLAGRAIGGPRWPWSRDKTVAGTLAFVIGGSVAGCGLAWWCCPAGDPGGADAARALAPPVAAVAAGSWRRSL
jgi:dolichol kinase